MSGEELSKIDAVLFVTAPSCVPSMNRRMSSLLSRVTAKWYQVSMAQVKARATTFTVPTVPSV